MVSVPAFSQLSVFPHWFSQLKDIYTENPGTFFWTKVLTKSADSIKQVNNVHANNLIFFIYENHMKTQNKFNGRGGTNSGCCGMVGAAWWFWTLEPESWHKPHYCHFLSVGSWENHLISLCLCLFICKMGACIRTYLIGVSELTFLCLTESAIYI